MQNIITGIVYPIIAGVGLMFVAFVLKAVLPNNAIIAMVMKKNTLRAMRYVFSALLMALCWLLLPFSKLFVFCIGLLFSFIVLMFVYDYAEAKFAGINRAMKAEIRENEIDKWTHQLAMCDYKDTERIKMIKAKLKELRK